MARIRTIKPEFWNHPVMGRQDDATKLLALALLNFSDDEGFFYADPTIVRSSCRPFDEDSTIVRRSLANLSKIDWIEVVEHHIQGPIGKIVKFSDHQKIDRPNPSKIKDHFISTNVRRMFDDQSLQEGKGKEGKGIGREEKILSGQEENPDPPDLIPYSEIIEGMNRILERDFKTCDGTRKLIKTRWSEGHRLNDFFLTCKNMKAAWGSDPEMVIYLRPQTLFGPKFDSYRNAKQIQTQDKPFETLEQKKMKAMINNLAEWANDGQPEQERIHGNNNDPGGRVYDITNQGNSGNLLPLPGQLPDRSDQVRGR